MQIDSNMVQDLGTSYAFARLTDPALLALRGAGGRVRRLQPVAALRVRQVAALQREERRESILQSNGLRWSQARLIKEA